MKYHKPKVIEQKKKGFWEEIFELTYAAGLFKLWIKRGQFEEVNGYLDLELYGLKALKDGFVRGM
jgi:hypothetical protein